jgi:predicted nucleotidyltransferase
MRDYSQIGVEIIQELLKEVNDTTGPCFFPGKFKPPHKGHFEAAKYLTERPYINKVYVIISNVTKFGITPKDSLTIWQAYLAAEPNNKIEVKISTEGTPIKDIFRFAAQNEDLKSIYVASAKEEADDLGYFDKLQEKFPNIKKEVIPDQFGRISATQMRQAVKNGNFDEFAKFVPTTAYNKGKAKEVFGLLTKILEK